MKSLPNLIESMPDGLLVLDREFRIRFWNPEMERLTGYSEADVIGEICGFLDAQGRSADVRNCGEPIGESMLLRQPSVGDGVERWECSVRARSGEIIPVLKSARILRDSSGEATGLIVTLTDLRYRNRIGDEAPPGGREHGLERLAGGSHAMNEVYQRIRLAAGSDATVLIQGDTGTGKELVAEAIHRLSARRDGPFVKVNCSALPENLLESELFGHVKGSFTGAIADKVGRFEAAEGGTILLDEIGDLSPLIQLKLLRIIQERTYERVGETRERRADVRVIAATHRNLREGVAQGGIREDFYYRIKVFDIRMPSLVERKEDIPILAATFIDRFRQRTGKQIKGFSTEVDYVFMGYCWPGNVRELENAVEHAFVTCQGPVIELQDLPLDLRTARNRLAECRRRDLPTEAPPATPGPASAPGPGPGPGPGRGGSPRPTVRPAPGPAPALGGKQELLEVLESCGWNKARAARQLGVDRSTIWRRMQRWGIPSSR